MGLLPDIFMSLSILLLALATFFVIIKVLYDLRLINFNITFSKKFNLNMLRLTSSPKTTNHYIYYKIVLLCFISRIFIYLIAYLSYMLIKNENLDFMSSYMTLFNKWDSNHYLNIAQNWYVNFGDKKFLIVFLPLYPIVIRILNLFIGDIAFSSVVVSNIFLIMSSIYIYKLTLLDFDSNTAYRAVKYLLIFPVSFFLGISYSESLFIFLCCGCLYYCRTQRWGVAALLAFLASLTRSMGILLVFPMFIELLLEYKNNDTPKIKDYFYSLFKYKTLCVIAPFLGLFSYMLINYSVTGSFTTFMEYQEDHWHQKFGLFFKNIKMFVDNAMNWEPSETASLWIPQLFIIFTVLLIIIYSINKVRSSYSVFMIVFFLMAVSPTWLLSGPRYFLSLFPIFISLALLGKSRTWDNIITFISTMCLCYCTIAFVLGYALM